MSRGGSNDAILVFNGWGAKQASFLACLSRQHMSEETHGVLHGVKVHASRHDDGFSLS